LRRSLRVGEWIKTHVSARSIDLVGIACTVNVAGLGATWIPRAGSKPALLVH
jgi:hypothetical protein